MLALAGMLLYKEEGSILVLALAEMLLFKEDRSILALAQAGKWRLKVQQLKNSRFSDKFDEKNEPFKDAGGRLGVS